MKRTNSVWIVVSAVAGASCLVAGMAIGAKMGFVLAETAMPDGAAVSVPVNRDYGASTAVPAAGIVLSGTIKAVGQNQMTISLDAVVAPNGQAKENDRTITLSDKTIFSKQAMVSAEKFAEEMAAYQKAAKAPRKNGVEPPMALPVPFSETPANASDLKAGLHATVYSSAAVGQTGAVMADRIVIGDQAAPPAADNK